MTTDENPGYFEAKRVVHSHDRLNLQLLRSPSDNVQHGRVLR